MVVTDASVILSLLLGKDSDGKISERLRKSKDGLSAPHLIDIEVLQVLRRYWLSREVTETRAEEAIEDFLEFPIEKYPHEILLNEIWNFRANCSAYDGAYVALAALLNAPLLTCDKKLAQFAKKWVKVEVY